MAIGQRQALVHAREILRAAVTGGAENPSLPYGNAAVRKTQKPCLGIEDVTRAEVGGTHGKATSVREHTGMTWTTYCGQLKWAPTLLPSFSFALLLN